MKAVRNNNFITWPGLTKTLIKNYLPISAATVQGHLHKQRQNLQSTQYTDTSNNNTIDHKAEIDIFPKAPTPHKKCNQVAYILINQNDLLAAYQDLTGRFPVKSLGGNEYVLVGYHYDANCIIGHPVKDRRAPTLTKAWQQLHDEFKIAGIEPEV